MTDMFYEELFTPSPDVQNFTLMVTRTLYLTAFVTTTATETETATGTLAAQITTTTEPTNVPQLGFEIPHHPKVDSVFTALFSLIWLLLTLGIVFRKKSKKLRSFNVPLTIGVFLNALGHFLHADYTFMSKKYELGRVVRLILTLAPIFYSSALFAIHRKTRNRKTVHSAIIFSFLSGINVIYCLIAAFGDGAVLFYTGQKWGEMDVAKHLAVSQVFGQQLLLCIMLGMWLRGRNITEEVGASPTREEILGLWTIPTILAALIVRVSAQFIMIIRNDQCFVVYEVLERSAEIHFASAGALLVAALISVVCQGWLWMRERRADKSRRDGEQNRNAIGWTQPPPPEKDG